MSTDWSERAKAVLKSELTRRSITYGRLAELLTGDGHPITEQGLTKKISRGGFSAAFLVQCLNLIGARDVRVD